jgi:hypothetical protein
MRNLSAEALASIHAERTAQVWLTLIELGGAGIPAPIRLVANPENIVSRGYTYIGFPFEIDLPRQSGEGRAAQLSIDNTDREIVRLLRELDQAPDVLIEIVLADSPDTVEFQLPGLRLRNIEWTVARVTGDLVFEDTLGEPACDTMTPSRFPGEF